jgi:ribosomal protein L37AE/L43A
VRCMRCQSNKREFLPQRIFELEGKRYAVWQCRNCKTAMLTRQKTWMKETARPECAACGSKRIALYYTTTVWACHQCGEYQTKHATSLKALQAPPVMPCETCGLQSWQYLCMHLPVYYKCKNCGSQSTLGVATKDIGSIELPRQCHACDGGELLLTLPFHRGDEELSQCPYCGSKKANVQLRSGRVMEGQCSDCTGFTSSNEESLFAVNLQCTGCGVGGIVYISCEVARQVFEQVGLRISKAL